MKNISFIFILSLAVFAFFTQSAFAIEAPTFFSCLNPQGSIQASYSSGTHGVPNDTTHDGQDTVYSLGNGNYVQCFCGLPNGIQTNWLDVSNYSQADINSLTSQGWFYVANGQPWGLNSSPYLTRNIPYTCLFAGSGEVLGIGTGGQVLGLANTGNWFSIATVLFLGFCALYFSWILRKGHKS